MDDEKFRQLKDGAAEDLNELHARGAKGAVDPDELAALEIFRMFVAYFFRDKGFTFGKPADLLRLMVAIDRYARDNRIDDNPYGYSKRVPTTDIVQAVGIMIRIDRCIEVPIGKRQDAVAKRTSVESYQLYDSRDLAKYRKTYINYIEDVLSDPDIRDSIWDSSGNPPLPPKPDTKHFTITEGRPMAFDGVDVGLQVLVGSFGKYYRESDVIATMEDETHKWKAPDELLAYVPPFAKQRGFHPGGIARLNSADIMTYTEDGVTEKQRVRLDIMPSTYFDMLATNQALGPFNAKEAPLLVDRTALARTKLSNMMGMELVLVTTDGYAPIYKRAKNMALLTDCWQSSSGESVQIPKDLDEHHQPSIFLAAVRGVKEESGLSRDLVHDLKLMALVATPEFANIGVIMCGSLRCTSDELAGMIHQASLRAPDFWEYTTKDIVSIKDPYQLARVLTKTEEKDGTECQGWTKQSAAAMIFAHAHYVGDLGPLARAIKANGGLKLVAGAGDRGIIPPERRDELVEKYVL